jgi:PTS system nitrogen regulatory IIA component
MQSLSQLLTPSRTLCGLRRSSKKAIFEAVAEVLVADHPELDAAEVIANLLAREKLGSTGLGGGIAIPHCRLGACDRPLGVLLTLAAPAEFDAPDGEPVDLLFALLVPEEAQQEHLDILATIARLFSQEDLCRALRASSSAEELYSTAVGWEG